MRPAIPLLISPIASKAISHFLCSSWYRKLSQIISISARASPRANLLPTSRTQIAFSYLPTPKRTMSSAIPDRYKLIFFVPHSHLDVCKEAVFATGAGTFPGGKYAKCAFQMPGQGQFLPCGEANPMIGSVGDLEFVDEMKVEIMCVGRSVMLQAVEALKDAHPYEEVAYEVYRMENV